MHTVTRRSFLAAAALSPLALSARPVRLYADGLETLLSQGGGPEYIRCSNGEGSIHLSGRLSVLP